MMAKFDGSIPQSMCLSLYKKALGAAKASESISIQTVANLVIQYKIGGYGKLILGDWLEKHRAKWRDSKNKK